jgi:hypothetical protein
MTTSKMIAQRFADLLKAKIGDENFNEVVRLNKQRHADYSGRFVNSNKLMEEALRLEGIEPDTGVGMVMHSIARDCWIDMSL